METRRQRLSRSFAYANRELKDRFYAATGSEFAFDYVAAIMLWPADVINSYKKRPWSSSEEGRLSEVPRD